MVALPGPPLVRATTESKTFSVPLMLKMIDESSTGSDSGRTMWRTRRQPGGAVEAGGFDDVVGDVDQAGVEQHGVEAHRPPEVHDDDDQEGAVPAPNQSIEPMPNAFEAELTGPFCGAISNSLLEQQGDGDRGQDDREEHERADQGRSAFQHEDVEQREQVTEQDLADRQDDRVPDGEPESVADVRIGEELREVVEPTNLNPVIALPWRNV